MELAKCIFGLTLAMGAFYSPQEIRRALRLDAVFSDSRCEPKIGELSVTSIISPLDFLSYKLESRLLERHPDSRLLGIY